MRLDVTAQKVVFLISVPFHLIKYYGTELSYFHFSAISDLLMQTRKSVCLVEVKRQKEIGREVIAEMEEKVRLVPRRNGVSVRTALVYEGHLAPIVEADGYFNSVIPFRELLGI